MNKVARCTIILAALCGAEGIVVAADAEAHLSPKESSDPPITDYLLGPGDQIAIRAPHFDELGDEPITIGLDGEIRLPVTGRVPAAGLSSADLEKELETRLTDYLLHPDVSITVVEFRSQPVSVLGAVREPGIQQVQGRRTLVEMISLAGGLTDNAGSTVKLTRRLTRGRIPLAEAYIDDTGQFSIAEIDLKSIVNAVNPEQNILVDAEDVITVAEADRIYVIGEVERSGSYNVNERTQATVLQALSLAGGLGSMAQPKNASILRLAANSTDRVEIPVNVRDILNGKQKDVPLVPEDILFIPDNLPKKAAARAFEAVIQMATGVVIWRRY